MRKLMITVWMLVAGTCLAQQIDLKSLDKFAALAKGKTEINMDEAMLKSAAGFLNESNKEEAAAKKSAQDLKGFFLRAYEFPQKGMFKLEDLKPLLDQLKAPGWSSFLRAQEENEQTEIWMHSTNGKMDGFVLIAAEESEVVVMNAIGIANLADLAALGEFGKLAAEKAATPQPNQPAPKPAGQKDDD
jgi:hypothetical protein